MTATQQSTPARPLTREELLLRNGKIIYVAMPGTVAGESLCTEPYLVFGSQQRIYGLVAAPAFEDYGIHWVAFDLEPSLQQLQALSPRISWASGMILQQEAHPTATALKG